MNMPKSIAAAIALAGSSGATAEGAVIAKWTFETSLPVTGGSLAPEAGVGSASSATGGSYGNPAGNGSNESWNSNGWDPGEFYQFQVSTIGLENVKISWDQTRSSSGPNHFKLRWSIDGTTFNDCVTYTIIENSNVGLPTRTGWNSITAQPVYTLSQDLTAITTLNDDSSIFVRLENAEGAPSTGTGTNRVDNVEITATAIPEPASLAMLGLIGAGLFARRRR